MLLQQRQPPPNTLDNQVSQVTVTGSEGGKYFSTNYISQGNPAAGPSDLIEGDLDVGMNEDDLLGDFGDDFNILEFADALDGNDTKTNILDDLEAEETKEGEKDDAKPPPYPPPQGPPPPYPGPHKVSDWKA